MAGKVTIRDVAKAANVSITAVSLYLNDKPGLGDATRQRIAETIRRLLSLQFPLLCLHNFFVEILY